MTERHPPVSAEQIALMRDDVNALYTEFRNFASVSHSSRRSPNFHALTRDFAGCRDALRSMCDQANRVDQGMESGHELVRELQNSMGELRDVIRTAEKALVTDGVGSERPIRKNVAKAWDAWRDLQQSMAVAGYEIREYPSEEWGERRVLQARKYFQKEGDAFYEVMDTVRQQTTALCDLCLGLGFDTLGNDGMEAFNIYTSTVSQDFSKDTPPGELPTLDKTDRCISAVRAAHHALERADSLKQHFSHADGRKYEDLRKALVPAVQKAARVLSEIDLEQKHYDIYALAELGVGDAHLR